MTMILIAVLNGVAQAAAFALLVRFAGPRYRLGLHAALLLVAALLYVAFAARAGDWSGVVLELGGTAAFGAVALHGLRRGSAALVALGWALHPAWDAALHTGGMGSYTPDGWVAACFGFDLLLAALIARGWAGIPAHPRVSAA